MNDLKLVIGAFCVAFPINKVFDIVLKSELLSFIMTLIFTIGVLLMIEGRKEEE